MGARNDHVRSVVASRLRRSIRRGSVDALSREGLTVDGSDEIPGRADALYQQILRSSELSVSVDVGMVADLAMALATGGALRELSDCTDLASTGGPGSIST